MSKHIFLAICRWAAALAVAFAALPAHASFLSGDALETLGVQAPYLLVDTLALIHVRAVDE